jgi:signal transduction histidine kinase
MQFSVSSIDPISLAIGFGVGLLTSLIIALPLARKQIAAKSFAELKGLKDQFIALCSHYLLSPITIIQTAISQLQEESFGTTPEQRRRLYENIFRGQQRLWLLAEQFLMVEQLESGELKLQISVSNLTDVVTQAVVTTDPFAREKQIVFRITDDEQHEVREGRFDARRLKLAIVAVLENAVKFSPAGSEIGIFVLSQNGMFTIEVSDAGPGMSKEVLSHLGEGFYRGSSVYNFDYEGMGLGTYITNSILQLHGGTVSYESRPGKGAVVRLQMPVE